MVTALYTLDTTTFDEPELWRANLGTAFCDLVPGQLDHELAQQGTLRGGRLGMVSVFTVSGSPQTVRRGATAVRHSPADMLKVCVQLRGRATVHQDDREIVLTPGQLAMYDTSRAYALRLEGTWTCAVIAIPRDQIALAPRTLSGAMERAHLAGRGPGLLLSQFITSTVRELETADLAASRMLGEAGACLVAGTLTSQGDAAAQAGSDTVREGVLAYIRARLQDPRLSRATVAAAHHMSPRTLDRLFRGQEWSVSGYIRHERLEAVRRDLADPALRHHSVSALAARWCFFDAAHFSRLFRESYGYPPSMARKP